MMSVQSRISLLPVLKIKGINTNVSKFQLKIPFVSKHLTIMGLSPKLELLLHRPTLLLYEVQNIVTEYGTLFGISIGTVQECSTNTWLYT
jgi:hypothetical protein